MYILIKGKVSKTGQKNTQEIFSSWFLLALIFHWNSLVCVLEHSQIFAPAAKEVLWPFVWDVTQDKVLHLPSPRKDTYHLVTKAETTRQAKVTKTQKPTQKHLDVFVVVLLVFGLSVKLYNYECQHLLYCTTRRWKQKFMNTEYTLIWLYTVHDYIIDCAHKSQSTHIRTYTEHKFCESSAQYIE